MLSENIGGALTHDFCPWANRYVYWMKTPIGWMMLALLASLLLGIYVSPQAYLASAGIVAVGVIGLCWPWVTVMGVSGELRWGVPRCSEGERVEASMVVTNRWPWPLWGLSVEFDPQLRPVGWGAARVSIKRIAAMSRSVYSWGVEPHGRGLYPTARVTLHTAFPFGIWTMSRPVEVPERLMVWPRLTRLVDVPGDLRCEQAGTGSVSQRCGDEGDWTGVRPYRPGDTLRQVHWPQTARRDALIVFERQATANPSVVVGMDVVSAQRADRETRDAMVRLYGSLCQQFQSHHWSLWVSMGDRGLVRLSPAQRVAFLDHLATWDFCIPAQSASQAASQVVSRKEADGLVNDRQSDFGIGAQRPGVRPAVADRMLWVTCGSAAGVAAIDKDALQQVGGARDLTIFRVVSDFASSIHSSSAGVQSNLVNEEQGIAEAGVSLGGGRIYSVTWTVAGKGLRGVKEVEQEIDREQENGRGQWADREKWDEQLQMVWRSYCTGSIGLGGSMRSAMAVGELEGVT